MPERRVIGPGPDAATVRNDREQPAVRRQHPPHLAQQRLGIVRHLDRMDHQNPIHRRIRQRQRHLIDQRRQRRAFRRPFQHALRRRHESQTALRRVAKQSQIGGGIADAEHALVLGIRPARLDAAIDQPPRRDAEPLRIEVPEIDDVDGHGRTLACHRGHSPNRIAAGAHKPYLKSSPQKTESAHGRRNSPVPLPRRQFRLSDPRSRQQGDRRHRCAGSRTDHRGAGQGRLDADRHSGHAPSRRPCRRHRRIETAIHLPRRCPARQEGRDQAGRSARQGRRPRDGRRAHRARHRDARSYARSYLVHIRR